MVPGEGLNVDFRVMIQAGVLDVAEGDLRPALVGSEPVALADRGVDRRFFGGQVGGPLKENPAVDKAQASVGVPPAGRFPAGGVRRNGILTRSPGEEQ